jgi:hypothetical protein
VPPCDRVEFVPRRQQGRLVLRRASWKVPARQIPLRSGTEPEFEYFVRVQRWQAEHRLPDEVFARPSGMAAPVSPAARKPTWISFKSPHTLEVLRQMTDQGGESISFVEALPARRQHWVHDGSTTAAGRVSEFMSLIRWPPPEGEPAASSPFVNRAVRQAAHSADDWLCLNIYAPGPSELDDVVHGALARTVSLARQVDTVHRWFFIRCVDQRGWHVRLRLEGTSAARAAWREHLPSGLADHTVEPYAPEYCKYDGPEGERWPRACSTPRAPSSCSQRRWCGTPG